MIGLLLFAQIVVVAHAPDTASTCAPIEISVAARAPGFVAPRIGVPSLPATMQLLRTTSISRIEKDGNGGASALTEAVFTIASDAAGRVAMPIFVASVGADRSSVSPSAVDIRSAQSPPPSVVVRAWLDRAGHGVASDTLYVGQQVDYVVDVHLNESARQRLRRNPTFFPPEMPGVLAYDLAPPTAITRTGRRCFETLSYRRALFPLFAGRTVISPAALTYSLPLSTSFFSREESFELRTDSVRFVALDVPVSGRPVDFAGAVGSVAASQKLSSTSSRMGDPVVLTMRLEGAGNVKLWPRPTLSVPWATVAQGAERVRVDTSLARVRGSKEFDWLLTPRQAGRQEIPALSYPFFDADKGSYSTAQAQPLGLDIKSATLVASDSTPASHLAIRRALREEVPPPLPARPWFWLLLAVAPVPAAYRRARDRARLRTRAGSPIQRLKAAAAGKERLVPRDVRRLYLDALRARVPIKSNALQRVEFARALRRAGVTVETADAATALLEQLDSAAYSPNGVLDPDAMKSAAAIVRDVDAQAVRPPKVISSARGFAIVATFLALSSGVISALPDGVNTTFDQGVAAYDHAAFTTAQRLFARVTTRAPRAADAWANLGAAAWAQGDTAAAVRAWQRTLRLEPLDSETRDRMAVVLAPQVRSPGFVAPLPVNALGSMALAMWSIAWMVLFVPPARRPPNARAWCGGALSIAVVFLVGALEARNRLDHAGLGLLRSSRLLLAAPNSSASLASGTTGEIGRLGPREGPWVRIELDATRAGWVPAESVLPMDAPPTDN